MLHNLTCLLKKSILMEKETLYKCKVSLIIYYREKVSYEYCIAVQTIKKVENNSV